MRREEHDSEGYRSNGARGTRLDISSTDGRDEMNLVEFPLTGVSDRFLDGRKTVVLADQVWDRDRKTLVDRELSISGSDRYGLPTAKDEDVLLACIQLSASQDFRHRQQQFSRYELLKLLGLSDESKNYARLSTSLRRWKGVTIYSNRAFYDHGRSSWVNRDFGIFDNLTIYEKETTKHGQAVSASSFVWNEVLFDSFQAGFVKRLDWQLYCRLTDPVAKRLYRLLDKRFYHASEVEFDLHDLAIKKLRLSKHYNTAQIKRALAKGIGELEKLWTLRAVPLEQRFIKQAPGKWRIAFQRRRTRTSAAAVQRVKIAADQLETALKRRGIGPATVDELIEQHASETIQTMVELFDWYQQQGQEKGPGFLVHSIRNASEYRLPRGFRPSTGNHRVSQRSRLPAHHIRRANDTDLAQAVVNPGNPSDGFETFWGRLNDHERASFESEAVQNAVGAKREGYLRLRPTGGPGFEQYRQIVLRDHYCDIQRAK